MKRLVTIAITICIIILCATLVAKAQDAKVIALSSEDAAMAKSLDDQKHALDKTIAEFTSHIAKQYLTTYDNKLSGSCSAEPFVIAGSFNVATGTLLAYSGSGTWQADKTTGTEKKTVPQKPSLMYKLGWGCGNFQYSDDFKYIVPITYPSIATPTTYCTPWISR